MVERICSGKDLWWKGSVVERVCGVKDLWWKGRIDPQFLKQGRSHNEERERSV